VTTNIFTVEEDNVSVAWLKAVERLVSCGGEYFNLMLSIKNPTQIEPTIHAAYEQLLSDHGLLTLKQVVYTIFPRSLYLQVNKDPESLFDRYNRPNGVYDRLKRRHRRKFGWGSYFRRMTCYLVSDENGRTTVVNQLGEIIHMLQDRARTYKAAYTISLQIPGMDGRRIMGGPCLNYVALQLDSPRILNALAVYRNHDFIQRAYGNYLGLGYMMEFICDQTGYLMGRLNCLSSHASIANIAGADSWPSATEIRSIIQDSQKP
jgi:hypothetical protein